MKPLCLESEAIVDAIFEACQSDVASPGLVLEDVQGKACITAVDEFVGGSNGGNIDDLFEVADSNGDGIVMRSEVSDAFQALTLQRSSPSKPPCERVQGQECGMFGTPYPGGCVNINVFKCNGKNVCDPDYSNCRTCQCP